MGIVSLVGWVGWISPTILAFGFEESVLVHIQLRVHMWEIDFWRFCTDRGVSSNRYKIFARAETLHDPFEAPHGDRPRLS